MTRMLPSADTSLSITVCHPDHPQVRVKLGLDDIAELAGEVSWWRWPVPLDDDVHVFTVCCIWWSCDAACCCCSSMWDSTTGACCVCRRCQSKWRQQTCSLAGSILHSKTFEKCQYVLLLTSSSTCMKLIWLCSSHSQQTLTRVYDHSSTCHIIALNSL